MISWNEAGERAWVCPASGRRYVERDGALSPEEAQASSATETTGEGNGNA